MSSIFVDTGPIRGLVWAHDKYHEPCESFFSGHPFAAHHYFYCDTVKSELMGFVRRLEALPLDRSGMRQVKNMRKMIAALLGEMQRVEFSQEPPYSGLVETIHRVLRETNSGGKEPNQTNDAKIVAHALICADREGQILLTTVDGRDIGDNERPFNRVFVEALGERDEWPLRIICLC